MHQETTLLQSVSVYEAEYCKNTTIPLVIRIPGLGAGVTYVIPFMSVNRSFMGDSCHSMAMSLATTGAGLGTLCFGPINEWLLCKYSQQR